MLKVPARGAGNCTSELVAAPDDDDDEEEDGGDGVPLSLRRMIRGLVEGACPWDEATENDRAVDADRVDVAASEAWPCSACWRS